MSKRRELSPEDRKRAKELVELGVPINKGGERVVTRTPISLRQKAARGFAPGDVTPSDELRDQYIREVTPEVLPAARAAAIIEDEIRLGEGVKRYMRDMGVSPIDPFRGPGLRLDRELLNADVQLVLGSVVVESSRRSGIPVEEAEATRMASLRRLQVEMYGSEGDVPFHELNGLKRVEVEEAIRSGSFQPNSPTLSEKLWAVANGLVGRKQMVVRKVR